MHVLCFQNHSMSVKCLQHKCNYACNRKQEFFLEKINLVFTGCPTWIATKVNKCCDYVFRVTLFPSDLCWKHVYILIFGIYIFFWIFQSMNWGIFHFFFIFLKNEKYPFEKFENKNYSKNQNVHMFPAWIWREKCLTQKTKSQHSFTFVAIHVGHPVPTSEF